jgi:hypothetical protein
MERNNLSNMSRKLIIFAILLSCVTSYSQNYEVYTGVVKGDYNAGGLIGLNFVIKTDQHREYLNNLIFGFEHSLFMSDPNTTIIKSDVNGSTDVNCNCTSSPLGTDNTYTYTEKNVVRGVALNMGVEIKNRWYLMTGVTSYGNTHIVNNEKQPTKRNMVINAGLKYFIKTKHWFISPSINFNPETVSATIGLSYN